jgi:hypothetical protein
MIEVSRAHWGGRRAQKWSNPANRGRSVLISFFRDFSKPVQSLAYKYIHSHPPILRLAFRSSIVCEWVSFRHACGGEHAIGFPPAGLLEIIDNPAGALFTQLLVEFLATCRICVADNKDKGRSSCRLLLRWLRTDRPCPVRTDWPCPHQSLHWLCL